VTEDKPEIALDGRETYLA